MRRITTTYAPDADMTFILEYRDTSEGMTLSVIGWYAGEPDEDRTKEWAGAGLTATYPEMTVADLFD